MFYTNKKNKLKMKKIPYGRQFIDNKDKKSVVKVLFNELITTGSQVTKFEKKLNGFLKVNSAMFVIVVLQQSIWRCYQLIQKKMT